MSPIKKNSNSLENFSNSQLEAIVKSNDALDKEEAKWLKEESEEKKRKILERKSSNNTLIRLRKPPLEILSRILFFFFLGSFLFSFVLVYAANIWWFFWYLISLLASILYTPNRKAIKELLDAWPNIVGLLRSRWK